MFCPKCSQKQLSEDVRFCSRCGFQMEGVMRLLANDGIIPAEEQTKRSVLRRAASTFGAKIIFSSFVLFVFAFIFAVAVGAPEFLIFPFLLFIIGLAQMLYVLIFGKTSPGADEEEPARSFKRGETRRELPPLQSVPVSGYRSPGRVDGEMSQPPSVTEPTTKLFKHEGETNDL